MTALTPEAATEALDAGAAALGEVLNTTQRQQLLDYLALLQKWNRVYNLTAVRDPTEMLTHHLLDSLAVLGPLRRQLGVANPASAAGHGAGPAQPASPRLLDVGSGAGLPGVVIAIGCPGISVTCVDTVAKKATFIQQVAISLKLPNLRGLHARVEALTEPVFDVISSRAFASLGDFTTWSASALAPQGAWMAMKGKRPVDECAALPSGVEVFHVEPLQVPGLDAQRCLVWMRKVPAALA